MTIKRYPYYEQPIDGIDRETEYLNWLEKRPLPDWPGYRKPAKSTIERVLLIALKAVVIFLLMVIVGVTVPLFMHLMR